MRTLGSFLTIKFENFYSRLGGFIAARDPTFRVDWSSLQQDESIVGPEGIISRYKSGETANEADFCAQMIAAMGVTGRVTPVEFVAAWNAIFEIPAETVEGIKAEIRACPDVGLQADTNPTHMRFLQSVFHPDLQLDDATQRAALCGKPLILSFHVGVSSSVFATRDTRFEKAAARRLTEITRHSAPVQQARAPSPS
jgi:hypothetical protein